MAVCICTNSSQASKVSSAVMAGGGSVVSYYVNSFYGFPTEKFADAKTSVMTILLLTMNTHFICLAIPPMIACFYSYIRQCLLIFSFVAISVAVDTTRYLFS